VHPRFLGQPDECLPQHRSRHPLGPQLLFSGFASNLRSLLTLGAIYLAAVVAILAFRRWPTTVP
jgi:hypothetical protein